MRSDRQCRRVSCKLTFRPTWNRSSCDAWRSRHMTGIRRPPTCGMRWRHVAAPANGQKHGRAHGGASSRRPMGRYDFDSTLNAIALITIGGALLEEVDDLARHVDLGGALDTL